jgi:hypothetical protein
VQKLWVRTSYQMERPTQMLRHLRPCPDVSEEGAVSETGAEAFPNESSPALATPSLISAIYEHLDLPDPRQLRPCRNARAWQMVVRR